jgi:hypothetical protein
MSHVDESGHSSEDIVGTTLNFENLAGQVHYTLPVNCTTFIRSPHCLASWMRL